jgi:branched-chain amino acid transport system substrate-binding protein
VSPTRLASIALSLGLIATGSSGAPARAAEPYTIDAVLALTGPGAFLGKGEQQSLELAEKSVNQAGGIDGRPIHFVFHDDQTSPQIGVQLTSGLIAHKPAVILGSSLVAICRAMQPLVKTGPVDYCFSPGLHPPPGDYAFSPSVSTTDLAEAMMRYFRMKGWTRIAFMFSTDATGQEFEQGVKGILAKPENKSLTVVAAEHFATSDVSVSAQIQAIKAAKPQAFVAWSTGTPIATIFRGMIQGGLDVPMATTDGNMTYAQMKQYADFLPKQLYMPAGQFIMRDTTGLPPAVAKAHAEFYKAFDAVGAKPDEPSELAWEPAMIVVHALRKLGPKATAAQLREFLAHLKGYAGADGVYDFERVPQRGLDVSNAVITLWDAKAQTWDVVSKPGGAPLP